MITDPTRQTELRTPRRPTRTTTTVNHAQLAARLTSRDRWILRMLYEHRVLTTRNIADLAFPTLDRAQRRLPQLHRYHVIDQFRPLRARGTAPAHWVLAPAGAAVLAAETGLTVRELRYKHDKSLAIAHSLHLAHTLGVNEWFISLATTPHGHLAAWWSETRCLRLWGDLVRPDGYGRYTHPDSTIDFFLEYDLGTMSLSTVAGKLTDYAELARSTSIITPVLFWMPTTGRETTARQALHNTSSQLPTPASVPVATAAANLLNPTTVHPSPADRVWLPLDNPGTERVALHHLPALWPHLTPPPQPADPHTSTVSGDPTILAPVSPVLPRDPGGL